MQDLLDWNGETRLNDEDAPSDGCEDDTDPYGQEAFAYIDENGNEHPPYPVIWELPQAESNDESAMWKKDFSWRILLLLGIYVGSWITGYSYVGFGFNLLFYMQALRHEREGFTVIGFEQLRLLVVVYGLMFFMMIFLEYIGNMVENVFRNLPGCTGL